MRPAAALLASDLVARSTEILDVRVRGGAPGAHQRQACR